MWWYCLSHPWYWYSVSSLLFFLLSLVEGYQFSIPSQKNKNQQLLVVLFSSLFHWFSALSSIISFLLLTVLYKILIIFLLLIFLTLYNMVFLRFWFKLFSLQDKWGYWGSEKRDKQLKCTALYSFSYSIINAVVKTRKKKA